MLEKLIFPKKLSFRTRMAPRTKEYLLMKLVNLWWTSELTLISSEHSYSCATSTQWEARSVTTGISQPPEQTLFKVQVVFHHTSEHGCHATNWTPVKSGDFAIRSSVCIEVMNRDTS